MNCSRCGLGAVSLSPRLCRDHFIEYVETKVLKTIKEYGLIQETDSVCVAVSGGKDSMALLFILHKYFKKVSALAIDEGIKNYRAHTLAHLKTWCKENAVSLKVLSFQKEGGNSLDALMKKEKNPCTVCGMLRRKLLNRGARGQDKLALGHNLDDEAQTVLMNLLTYKPSLRLLQLPASPKKEGFVERIKPLCFLREKEILLYAVLQDLAPPFVECPYVRDSFRADVRDALNAYEAVHPGTKENIYRRHLHTVQAQTF